eukprot:m.481528 g.481528  ORF g.481528 m.481528 type:complete len:94 (+) comp21716_c2_seq25:353-634(+)
MHSPSPTCVCVCAAESTSQKFSRKIQSNPFIPLGLFATGFCLVGGLWAFRTGRQQLSNHFQRGRVLFQGVTVAAFLGQAYLDTQEKKEAAARA